MRAVLVVLVVVGELWCCHFVSIDDLDWYGQVIYNNVIGKYCFLRKMSSG